MLIAKPVKSGDPLESASTYNAIAQELERRSTLSVAGLLSAQRTPGGTVITRRQEPGFWAKLSGAASPYSFVEQYPAAAGTWQAAYRTGTTNAYEINGASGLTDKYVWLKPGNWDDYRFQYVRSGATGTGPITIPTPYCPCTATPAVLTMTSLNSTCDSGLFQSDIIRYGTTPAWATVSGGLTYGPNMWISDNSHLDSASGDYFYYAFGCEPGSFYIDRIYQTSIYGSPYQDIVRFFWNVPTAGNSCSPFLLTVGNTYSGSACPANTVHISG